jgi:hypothetical protein
MPIIQLSRRQQPAKQTASNEPAIIVTSAASTICDVDLSYVRIRIEMRKPTESVEIRKKYFFSRGLSACAASVPSRILPQKPRCPPKRIRRPTPSPSVASVTSVRCFPHSRVLGRKPACSPVPQRCEEEDDGCAEKSEAPDQIKIDPRTAEDSQPDEVVNDPRNDSGNN